MKTEGILASVLIAVMLMFIVAATASAEFYKYTDENGNVHFTDDINQVPPDQRQKLQRYEESASQPGEAPPAAQSKQPQEAQAESSLPGGEDEGQAKSLEETRKQLDAMKNELDGEYKALKQEQAKLAAEKSKTKTRADVLKYNKKVESLNQRIKAYEKKSKEYQSLVNDYNQQVIKQNAKAK